MSNATYNELATAIRGVLQKYTKLPDAILQAQCTGIGKTPSTINKQDLPRLAENINQALSLFTSPMKGQAAKHDILQL